MFDNNLQGRRTFRFRFPCATNEERMYENSE
jgi:hypothetical protein